jgi:3-phenylpropionate/cinnamic acid dioxygenase small subunit
MAPDNLSGTLLDEVTVIGAVDNTPTGAQSIAPDHAGRAGYRPVPAPTRGVGAEDTALQRQVEQFLFHQSELLDRKLWQAFIDMFTQDGVYWAPAAPEQTEWVDSPSIFAEDRALMQVRMARVMHPNAWSLAGSWETSHLIGNVVIESASDTAVSVRSRFQMLELRRDVIRHIGGTYRHTLQRNGGDFSIALQRVDLINAQAVWDYVLQVWV